METFQVDQAQLKKAWAAVWWIVLIQGLIALGFGLFMLFSPQRSAQFLVQVFAVFIILDGILDIVGSFLERKYIPSWGWRAAAGVLVIIAGLVFWAYSGLIANATLAILIWIVAIGLLISGISTVIQVLRGQRERPWSAILWAAVKVIVALVLMTQTGASATVLLWIFGAFLIVSGILALVLAFQLRALGHEALQQATTIVDMPPGDDAG